MIQPNLMGELKGHFKKMETYSTAQFILIVGLISLLYKYFISLAFFLLIFIVDILLFRKGTNITSDNNLILESQQILKDIEAGGTLGTIATFWAVFIGPLIETLTTQVIPVWLTSKFTKKIKIMLFVSAGVFSITHGNPFLIILTFPLGILYAWCYIAMKKHSKLKGVWVTTTIHSIFNIFTLAINNLFNL